MQRLLTLIKIILLIIPLEFVLAQSKIEIINADEISFNQKLNKNRQVLSGNVKTKHENVIMTCDSAYYYSNENKIEAFNSIEILDKDRVSLKGEYLIYHGNKQLAEIEQDVVFMHNEMSLYSKKIIYDFTTKKGSFNDKAVITQNKKTISSKEGVYDSQEENFNFYKEVILIDQADTLTADNVSFNVKTEEANFYSNGIIKNESFKINAESGWVNQSNGDAILDGEIEIYNLIDGTKLFSDHCRIEGQKKTTISYGNPLLKIPSKEDTLYLTGDTLYHTNKEDLTIFSAAPTVVFQSKEIIGKCDSLVYKKKQKQISLFFLPAIWVNEFLLTADTILIRFEMDQFVNEIELKKNAFISSKINDKNYNQIKGEEMFAYFNDNKLNNINVDGNGESIYFIKEKDNNAVQGANKVICSNMSIFISANQIKSIAFYNNADAIINPIELVSTEELLLKNFVWYEKQKTFFKINEKVVKYR